MEPRQHLSLNRAREARSAAAEAVLHTPLLDAGWLSARLGATVAIKAENLQMTGSFKVRGATEKIERLIAEGGCSGVVAASAGNHGQAVAHAARRRGMPCRVFMPERASISKLEAVRAHEATVELVGQSVEECVERAREFAAAEGAALVHPYDDLDVLYGQATLGLEVLEDEPEPSTVVMPVGGGGLAGAVASVIKELRPGTRMIGVQVEGCSPYVPGTAPPGDRRIHLADGIAIKHPGELTAPLIEHYIDELCTVSEDAIAEAMVLLMQRSKLVTEGAGAASVAALLEGRAEVSPRGRTIALLSGGNVDVGVLVAVARRYESAAGRRLHLFTRVADTPGGLAGLLEVVAGAGANVLAAEHLREGVSLHIGETGVELVLETRGQRHSEEVIEALRSSGYPLEGGSA